MEHQRAIQNLSAERYVLGEMSPQERAGFEEHYFECSLCGEDVRSTVRFMDDAREILGEEASSDDRLQTRQPVQGAPRAAGLSGEGAFSGWLAWLKPQFAVPALAALLLIVGVQSLRTIPNLRREVVEAVAPRAVASIALRGAVRGPASTLVVPKGSAVLLTLDLPDVPAPAAPLEFVIESAEGKEVLRVSGSAPDPGKSVNLIIPRLDIPSGLYILVAAEAAAPGTPGQELGRFPFHLELQ